MGGEAGGIRRHPGGGEEARRGGGSFLDPRARQEKEETEETPGQAQNGQEVGATRDSPLQPDRVQKTGEPGPRLPADRHLQKPPLADLDQVGPRLDVKVGVRDLLAVHPHPALPDETPGFAARLRKTLVGQ